MLNTLKLFWFTLDSSVLLNEEVQFFFHDICHFFGCIVDCQSKDKLADEEEELLEDKDPFSCV